MDAEAAVMLVLNNCQGRERAVGRAVLLERVQEWGVDVNDRALRKIINGLRKDGELICSAGGVDGGYWLAKDWAELTAFLESEVHPRAMDLLATEKALREAAEKVWGPRPGRWRWCFEIGGWKLDGC